MSWHRFGTMSSKSAAAGSNADRFEMLAQRVGFVRIPSKLIAGSCLRAYVPEPSGPPVAVAPVKQPDGTFSAKTRHDRPWASS